MNDEKEVKKTSKQHKSRSQVAHYIYKPVIYVLIASIVIIPFVIGAYGVGSKIIKNNESFDHIDSYDVEVIDNGVDFSTVTSGQVKVGEILENEKFGKIVCERVGINCKVYKGVNRTVLRNGAGALSGLPGVNDAVQVVGYNTTVFKNLNDVVAGDTIVFETTYGLYTYSVTQTIVTELFDVGTLSGENIVLACKSGNGVFSNYNEQQLYVVAQLVSGPDAVMEVEE